MHILAYGAALASCAAFADIDVTAYGAKADGTTDNTAAIQKAIDACSAKGGGRVVVPGGGTYVTYTLNLKNNVEPITRGEVHFIRPFIAFTSEKTAAERLIEVCKEEWNIPEGEVRKAVREA